MFLLVITRQEHVTYEIQLLRNIILYTFIVPHTENEVHVQCNPTSHKNYMTVQNM